MWPKRRNPSETHILTKEDLTFARAVEMAETAERAEKDAAELQVATTPEVHRLPVREPTRDDRRESGTGRMRQHQSPQCFRCGRTHQPETCWFRDQQCRSCNLALWVYPLSCICSETCFGVL